MRSISLRINDYAAMMAFINISVLQFDINAIVGFIRVPLYHLSRFFLNPIQPPEGQVTEVIRIRTQVSSYQTENPYLNCQNCPGMALRHFNVNDYAFMAVHLQRE